MSAGPPPSAYLPTYDAPELRRRMAVGFTIGELYALASKLQVPQTPAWSNSPQDAARDIVRHFERSGALAFLVEELALAKPLVEWPAPQPAPEPPPAPPLPRGLPPAPHAADTLLGPGPSSAALAPSSPATDATSGDRPAPIAAAPAAQLLASATPGGFAPAAMPRPEDLPAGLSDVAAAAPPPAAAPSAFAPSAAEPVAATAPGGTLLDPHAPPASARPVGPTILDPHAPPASLRAAAPWPGTVRPAAPAARKGLDPRILLAAGAAVLIAAVTIAFVAGRASTPSDSAAAAGSAALPRDHIPIAALAALALGGSLERVAKECQVEVASLRGRSLFEVVNRRCGPPPPPTSDDPRVAGNPAPLPSDIDPTPDPDLTADPPADKKPRPSRFQKVDPGNSGVAPASGTNCLSGCSRDHRSCTAKCGAEPKQSSQYDAYQSCLGGCLKGMSHCKMGCQ